MHWANQIQYHNMAIFTLTHIVQRFVYRRDDGIKPTFYTFYTSLPLQILVSDSDSFQPSVLTVSDLINQPDSLGNSVTLKKKQHYSRLSTVIWEDFCGTTLHGSSYTWNTPVPHEDVSIYCLLFTFIFSSSFFLFLFREFGICPCVSFMWAVLHYIILLGLVIFIFYCVQHF